VRDGPVPITAVKEAVRSFLRGDDAPEPLLRELFLIAAWSENCLEKVAVSAGVRDGAGFTSGPSVASPAHA
jgi:hypothetical protein